MKSKVLGILLFLICLTPGSLLAQVFQASSVPAAVTATGQTEVIGTINVFLTQGPAVSGTLVVDLSPLRITNAAATDISVTTSGITVGATTIDTDNSLVLIPVNASASATALIKIDGIRVAVAGTGITSLNARLSFRNSTLDLFIGGSTVPVLNSVETGLPSHTHT